MPVLLFFISLLLASPLESDTSFVERSEKQADFFIEQLEKNPQSDTHLWALATNFINEPDTSSYVQQKISDSSLPEELVSHFDTEEKNTDFYGQLALQTGSPTLLIAALFETESSQRNLLVKDFETRHSYPEKNGTNFQKIIQHIAKGESLNLNDLPDINESPLIHFLLTIRGSDLISQDYHDEFNEYWNQVNLSNSSSSLEKSLVLGTLVLSNYRLEQDSENQALHSLLQRDELLPVSPATLYIYRVLDLSVYNQGYYDQSLAISRTFTVPLATYLGRTDQKLNSLMEQATSLYRIGKLKEAQEINLAVQKEAEEKEVDISQSYLLNNLGITYLKSGEFSRYLELQFESLEVAREEEKFSNELDILRNLHVYYKKFGETQSAEQYLDEARSLAEEHENEEELSKIYITSGVFQRDSNNNFERAEHYFQEAEHIIDREADHQRYVRLLLEQAELLNRQGHYEQSLQLFQQVETLSEEREDTPNYLEALVEQAHTHLHIEQPDSARSIINKLKDEPLDQLDFEKIVKARTIEADYLLDEGNVDQAYDLLDTVLEQVVNRAQSSTNLESGFWNIESEYLDAFDVMTELLLSTNRHEKAVEVLDQLKTINDPELFQNPMVKSSVLNETELSNYTRIQNELDSRRKQQLLASGNEAAKINNRINQLTSQKRTLDRKISEDADQSSISVREIQQRLSGTEAVLHITELNDRFYVANITKRNIQFDTIKMDSARTDLFQDAIQNVSVNKTDLKQLEEIADILNLRELPASIKDLTIIPDSYFYELPIDILPLNDVTESYNYGEATYMAEKFNSHYITTLNDYGHESDQKTKSTYDFVGYGVSDFNAYGQNKLVSLPYAGNEVNHITDNLSNLSKRTSFIDNASTETAFKSTASSARVLHLATHSELSDQDPLYSTIYMSPQLAGSDEDFPGQIFAYELFELDLDNELIMLNSCESGSGSYLQGSGVRGISRALRYAGARSLVLNLWSVNDMMASDFAIKFYKHINDGKSKVEAMKQTKLHFIKEKNANPHYWGPYMLIGDPSPVVESDKQFNTYIAASFMAYFLILIIISLFRQKNNFWIFNPEN